MIINQSMNTEKNKKDNFIIKKREINKIFMKKIIKEIIK